MYQWNLCLHQQPFVQICILQGSTVLFIHGLHHGLEGSKTWMYWTPHFHYFIDGTFKSNTFAESFAFVEIKIIIIFVSRPPLVWMLERDIQQEHVQFVSRPCFSMAGREPSCCDPTSPLWSKNSVKALGEGGGMKYEWIQLCFDGYVSKYPSKRLLKARKSVCVVEIGSSSCISLHQTSSWVAFHFIF